MEEKFLSAIRFIDLFAGIDGFNLAFSHLGCECVYSSEINRHACQMYQTNFGFDPYSDITKVDPDSIPDFDLLCAGFPCQASQLVENKKDLRMKQEGHYSLTFVVF